MWFDRRQRGRVSVRVPDQSRSFRDIVTAAGPEKLPASMEDSLSVLVHMHSQHSLSNLCHGNWWLDTLNKVHVHECSFAQTCHAESVVVIRDEHLGVDEVRVSLLLVCWQVAWIMMCRSDAKRGQQATDTCSGPHHMAFLCFFRLQCSFCMCGKNEPNLVFDFKSGHLFVLYLIKSAACYSSAQHERPWMTPGCGFGALLWKLHVAVLLPDSEVDQENPPALHDFHLSSSSCEIAIFFAQIPCLYLFSYQDADASLSFIPLRAFTCSPTCWCEAAHGVVPK